MRGAYLISTDELVAECESRHDTTLLQPEDGREGAREEYALDGCKRTETFTVRRIVAVHPLQCPVSLPLHTWQRLDGIEEKLSAMQQIYNASVMEKLLHTMALIMTMHNIVNKHINLHIATQCFT